MSSFGAAVVVDVPTEQADRVAAALTGLVEPSGEVDGLARLSGYTDDLERVQDAVALAVSGVEEARAALALDWDEYGAEFQVLSAEGIVYRAFVLNADPADPDAVETAVDDHEEDPRIGDLTGPAAANAAATLFGLDPQPMVQADATYTDTAWEEIGVIGGPFPWWGALGLEWPA